MTRSHCVRPLLGCLILWLGCLPIAAAAQQENPEKGAAQMVTPAAERAIHRGLTWLSSRQNDDGSFGSGTYRSNVAICALAGMALLSSGSTPGRGPYGGRIDRAVDHLLAHAEQSGYIFAPDEPEGRGMYGHGFATLFLAECYGMSPRPELREKLAKAVKLIVNTQNKDGGWRYRPVRDQADISVTVCEVMALRAGRNAGLYVPNETIDRSIDYVQRSQNADGGFMYIIQGGESAFPRSAAGVVALYSAGVYQGPQLAKGLDYLMQFLPEEGVVRRRDTYYEYGHYYAVQAMWQAGGKYFSRWYPAIRDDLLSRQQPDGSWTSSFGPEYATAMCCIILQVPNNYLPIFQR
jgi:squalene cyclase